MMKIFKKFKIKNEFIFWKKKKICFVNVETDPRLGYQCFKLKMENQFCSTENQLDFMFSKFWNPARFFKLKLFS
jgi:hypothetical protein